MAEVRIEHVFKRFGAVTAVNDFDLVVKDGEFVSILGPSGCGKTTTLRMIAGFERATEGEIYIGDHCVSSSIKGNFAPPEKRDIGMVFQSYAVWPHMTVAENVGYPLKIQKVDKKEREERVQKMLELVHLGEYSKRFRVPSCFSSIKLMPTPTTENRSIITAVPATACTNPRLLLVLFTSLVIFISPPMKTVVAFVPFFVPLLWICNEMASYRLWDCSWIFFFAMG